MISNKLWQNNLKLRTAQAFSKTPASSLSAFIWLRSILAQALIALFPRLQWTAVVYWMPSVWSHWRLPLVYDRDSVGGTPGCRMLMNCLFCTCSEHAAWEHVTPRAKTLPGHSDSSRLGGVQQHATSVISFQNLKSMTSCRAAQSI